MSDKKAATVWPMFVGLGLLALAYHVGSKPVGVKRVVKAAAPIDYARQRIAVSKPLVTNRDAQAGANIQAMGYTPPVKPSGGAPSGTGSGYSTLGQDPSVL